MSSEGSGREKWVEVSDVRRRREGSRGRKVDASRGREGKKGKRTEATSSSKASFTPIRVLAEHSIGGENEEREEDQLGLEGAEVVSFARRVRVNEN